MALYVGQDNPDRGMFKRKAYYVKAKEMASGRVRILLESNNYTLKDKKMTVPNKHVFHRFFQPIKEIRDWEWV